MSSSPRAWRPSIWPTGGYLPTCSDNFANEYIDICGFILNFLPIHTSLSQFLLFHSLSVLNTDKFWLWNRNDCYSTSGKRVRSTGNTDTITAERSTRYKTNFFKGGYLAKYSLLSTLRVDFVEVQDFFGQLQYVCCGPWLLIFKMVGSGSLIKMQTRVQQHNWGIITMVLISEIMHLRTFQTYIYFLSLFRWMFLYVHADVLFRMHGNEMLPQLDLVVWPSSSFNNRSFFLSNFWNFISRKGRRILIIICSFQSTNPHNEKIQIPNARACTTESLIAEDWR